MKTNILGSYCFFSFTWDYLNIYLPTQHRGSLETIRSYTDDLTVFRRYLTEELHLKMEKFLFSGVLPVKWTVKIFKDSKDVAFSGILFYAAARSFS